MPVDLTDPAALLAAIVTSSDDAIVSKDLNSIITSWNSAAERMFGWPARDAIGRSIEIIIPPERHAEEQFVMSRIRQGLAIEHFETVRQRRDGTAVEISLTVSPILAADGTVIGASKIARDISEQLRLRQEADEASRLKDEFLATLSHELRTPLNAVVGYASMLRNDALDAQQRLKAAEVIHRNAQTLTHMVGEMLDASGIVTGKMRLDVHECDLSAVVAESVDNIRPTIDAKRLELRTAITRGILVLGDRDRIRQIMWNLLANAVKFTPAGGRIDVELSLAPPHARVTVRDTGIGMTATTLPLVFQRFWQADGGRTREFGGLGLGLALTRHFVDLHGGTIRAKSDGPGTGTEFQVELPLR